MSHRLQVILEDREYEALKEKSELLSVSMGELTRRGIDRLLGLDGDPVGVWRHPGDSFVPRRPGVRFEL